MGLMEHLFMFAIGADVSNGLLPALLVREYSGISTIQAVVLRDGWLVVG